MNRSPGTSEEQLSSFREFVQRTRKHREFWDTVPASSVALLSGVAFCLLASIGAISQLASAHVSIAAFWVGAGATGMFGAIITWVTIRKSWWWIVGISPVAVAVVGLLSAFTQRQATQRLTLSVDAKQWIETGSETTIFLLMIGFILTMEFIRREGARFFRTHTEMRLAGEIHQALVPTIEREIGEYAFYATSLPSGMVGGDLIDLIDRNGDWLAYVADVSGHGVASGVVMAMVKSSTHMGMRFDSEAKRLLAGLNEVLCSLKARNMFATFGLVAYSPVEGLRYSLAGHPPILRRRGLTVEFLSDENLPIGVFPDASFQSTPLEIRAGDVLAVITDGLTEVFNTAGEELGMEAISEVLRVTGDRPLNEIAAAIFKRADQHGPRIDDQSLLLIRKTG
jgi:serine phosphatase RsbU (regulator of sigma subunit)